MLAPALLFALTLAQSTPGAEAAPKAAPAPAAPRLEVVIPEQMLEDFLEAAAPFEKTIVREVGMLGFTRKVEVDLTLTGPRVKVTRSGIAVTFDYVLEAGGLRSRGRATPKLVLKALPGKGLIEGRLTEARVSAAGGIDVPVEDLVAPFHFPAGAVGPVEVEGKTVLAQVEAKEILLEEGQVRVKADWSFKKAAVEATTTRP